MPVNDNFRRYLDAGILFGQMTRARAEEVVRDLVDAGDLSGDEAQQWADDLVERGRKTTELLMATVKQEVSAQLRAVGITSMDDVAHRVSDLLAAAGTATKRAPAKATAKKKTARPAARKAAAKKPAARKATAKKAAARKATAKKATAKKATTQRSTVKKSAKKPAAKKGASKKTTAKKAVPSRSAKSARAPKPAMARRARATARPEPAS